MKHLMLSIILLAAPTTQAVTAPTSAQAQPRFETINDLNTVLGLMKGDVDMYGDQFGSVPFQRGILTLAQSKTINVRVLTSAASVPNLRPLRAIGAKIYTLNSKFTGSLIIVRGKAVILPVGNTYQVLRTPAGVAQLQGLMEQYWPLAKAN